MIASASNRIADFFLSRGIIAAEEREVYAYGFAAIISTAISYGIILAIAFVLHCVWLWAIFIICFSPLRRYSGGYHASSYIRCKTIYAVTFFLIAIGVIFLMDIGWMFLPIAAGLFSFVIICLFAPVIPRNKELLEGEVAANRRKSILVSLIEGVGVLILLPFHYAISLSVSFIMLAVSIALLVEIFITKRSVKLCRKSPC